MSLNNDEQYLDVDRGDLKAILDMRFGESPLEITHKIDHIQDLNQLQRLIIVACNAPEWNVFLEELYQDDQANKLVGDRFNPMGITSMKG